MGWWLEHGCSWKVKHSWKAKRHKTGLVPTKVSWVNTDQLWKPPLSDWADSHRIACAHSHRIASHRIASQAGKCAHVRAFALHARNARIRIPCAKMRAFASHARKCAHSHRMRGNARITTRKTRKWDCGNDASPSVLAPDPWNWVCSR